MNQNDDSCEPMDIDLSTNSIKKETDSSYDEPLRYDPNIIIKQEKLDLNDVKDNEKTSPDVYEAIPTKTDSTNVKRYHINYQKRSNGTKHKLIGCSALIMLGLSLLIYQMMATFECGVNLRTLNFKQSLEDKLYGQKNAINKIMNAIESKPNNKILFLYGGTGVGKTYAVSVILGNMWNYSNVYHYTMPSFKDTFSPELMIGLTFCETSVLVVDDLKTTDSDISDLIQQYLDKSEKLSRQATVILIYNCDIISRNFVKKCDISFVNELKKRYKSVKAEKHYIQFVDLKETELIKCIENELKLRQVTNYNIDNILKNFDVSLDGCKGVHKKIKSLHLL